MIYREIEKMNSDSVSIGYDIYKSVITDNDKLREEIKVLEHQVKTWKTMSESNDSNFNFAMNSGAKTFQELLQEKRDHTKTKDLLEKEKRDHIETQARIVFAQHILSKNREEIVREFWDANKEYIDDYGI
jgi:cell division septum initiation protein DivIVA